MKSDLQGGRGQEEHPGKDQGQADGAPRALMARTRAGVAVRWRVRVLFRERDLRAKISVERGVRPENSYLP